MRVEWAFPLNATVAHLAVTGRTVKASMPGLTVEYADIELPAPTCTVWCDGGSAQPTYQMQYVQDTNIVIAELRAALADLATS